MRGQMGVSMLAVVLAGCTAGMIPLEQAQELRFSEALDLAQALVPEGFVLAEAHASTAMDVARVPSGLSAAWRLRFIDEGETEFVDIEVRDGRPQSLGGGPIGEQNVRSGVATAWTHGCPAAWDLDSPAIGAAVAQTPQWARVWDVARTRPPVDPRLNDPDMASMSLECVEDAQYWSVLTPFLHNEDGRFSVRMFMLSLDGRLAGFDDGDRQGGLSMGQGGLAVQRFFIPTDWTAADTSGRTTFEAWGATRLAIHGQLDYQGLPLLGAQGQLRVVDPAGQRHVVAWDNMGAAEEEFHLVLDPLPVEAASGTWTIEAESGPPWGLGYLRLRGCAGIPSTHLSDDPACALLV